MLPGMEENPPSPKGFVFFIFILSKIDKFVFLKG